MTFISEVREHPSALRALLEVEANFAAREALVAFLGEQKPKRIIFSGMGSSYFSSQAAALYLSRNGFDAVAIESGELLAANPQALRRADLLVAVSQTGGSPELVALCSAARDKLPILSVTNRPKSAVGSAGNFVLELYAGEENFTSSKTYTNTLAALLLIADALLASQGLTPNSLPPLSECAKLMESLLAREDELSALGAALASIEAYTMIGSGFSWVTAQHGELIAAEAGRVFSSRFTLGQFIHGPVEMVRPGYAYFLFDSDPAFSAASSRIMDIVLGMGGTIVRVSTTPCGRTHENLREILLPSCPLEWLPLLEVIVLELIINRVGLDKGLNPGALAIVQK